jgi:hypothetical protein
MTTMSRIIAYSTADKADVLKFIGRPGTSPPTRNAAWAVCGSGPREANSPSNSRTSTGA